jgi:uncharacterized protein (DUF779 family)
MYSPHMYYMPHHFHPCMYHITFTHLSNHCCHGKASIIYSRQEFVAFVILSSVACPALQNFSTLSHKWQDIWKTLLNIKCVFWFSLQLFV